MNNKTRKIIKSMKKASVHLATPTKPHKRQLTVSEPLLNLPVIQLGHCSAYARLVMINNSIRNH